MKLSGASRAIIGAVVSRYHVGTPDKEVRAHALASLRPDAPAEFRRAVSRYAVQVHHANQRLYRAVMSGRFS